MWPSALILFTFFLFLLPLLPGILELSLASDATPLKVIQEYDTDITYFAIGFKQYLEKNFASFFAVQNKAGAPFQQGTLDDLTDFQVIRYGKEPFFDKKETNRSHTSKLIIADQSLKLPEKFLFEKEIYSASSITTGGHSQFRAILAEGNITLGEGCAILRWVHSNASLIVGKGCDLYGRASAEKTISLSEHCQFERIHAPRILFGYSERGYVAANDAGGLTKLETIPNVKDQYGNRWLVDGDINIPEAHFFEGDLVAGGNIVIADGAYVKGSLKSNKHLTLGKNARVTGAIISTGDIHIAQGCHITGPVVAEGNVFIASGSVIGLENAPTTLTAANITIISGVTVYGTVWAEEHAQTLTRAAA